MRAKTKQWIGRFMLALLFGAVCFVGAGFKGIAVAAAVVALFAYICVAAYLMTTEDKSPW